MADPVKTDRAVHYRQMALDALRQAARSVSSRQRDLWLQLAQDWQSRALELEDRNHQPQGYDFYSALASVLMRALVSGVRLRESRVALRKAHIAEARCGVLICPFGQHTLGTFRDCW